MKVEIERGENGYILRFVKPYVFSPEIYSTFDEVILRIKNVFDVYYYEIQWKDVSHDA